MTNDYAVALSDFRLGAMGCVQRYLTRVRLRYATYPETVAAEAARMLDDYSVRLRDGKQTRIGLVALGYWLARPEPLPRLALPIAGSIELLHNSLLMYDVVDDRAVGRLNGSDSNQSQTKTVALGAWGLVLSEDMLLRCGATSRQLGRLQRLRLRSLLHAGVGQSLDVSRWCPSHHLGELVWAYWLKTAQYSGTLPVVSGAILASRGDVTREARLCGSYVGLAIQILDDCADYRNLAQSDIAMGRPNILCCLAYRRSEVAARRAMRDMYRRLPLDAADAERLSAIIDGSGVLDDAVGRARHYHDKARALVLSASAPSHGAALAAILSDMIGAYSMPVTPPCAP